MLKFNPTTPIRFYAKTNSYVAGQGNTESWIQLNNTIFCEWKNSFGERAISFKALGIDDSATIRTFYHPGIIQKLKTVQVIVIKNADLSAVVNGVPDKNNPNVYELWGGVDNVLEENQFMEFRVRRFEGI